MLRTWLALSSLALLLAIAATEADEPAPASQVRCKELRVPQSGHPGFSPLSSDETGIQFINRLESASSAANRVLENGSGVALGDYDGDGWTDVFLCAISGGSALYRNLGDWRFADVTAAAGLQLVQVQARGAVFADINADRLLDLLVSTVNTGVLCFTNCGRGIFQAAPSLSSNLGCTTLALADVDGNSTLDLFVATYRADDIRDRARIDVQRVGGRVQVAPWLRERVALTEKGIIEFGDPDLLYLNDGHGRFTQVDAAACFQDAQGNPVAAVPRDWGLAAAFRDLNNDGWPDLYVCNDYWTPDRLWLNKAGLFHAAPALALRHTSENSMGVDFADLNHDGHVDFFVTDMLSRDPARRKRQALAQSTFASAPGEITSRPQYMRNMLFLNNGDGTFAEIAEYTGVAASDWSWQPFFIDLDLDGHVDLLIPAGHSRDVQDLDATAAIKAQQRPWPKGIDPGRMQELFTREKMEHSRLYPSYESPIFTFRNRGDLTFEDMTRHWGTAQLAVHQGLALGDLDNDGDLDFVVNNLNSPAGVFRNNCPAPRVTVRLRGSNGNTQAIGARVTLRAEGLPPQTQEVVSGGKYLSGCDTELVFAAGQQDSSCHIRWRSGKETVVHDVQPNCAYEIWEAATPPAALGGSDAIVKKPL